MTTPTGSHGRLKRAETTSTVGAGVLGAGLALLVGDRLAAYALPILFTGLVTHVWGMYDKHRLEGRVGESRLWWTEMLYWACWIGLLVLFAYVLVGR